MDWILFRCAAAIEQVSPSAVYIHCYAHKLNLALVDCVKSNQLANDFFCWLEALYVYISTTKAHSVFIAKQKELQPEKQVHQLQKLSDTWWACRQSAVNAICCTYKSLLATLEEASEGTDRAKAVEATGLLLQIKTFKFLLSLIMFDRVLTCSKSLSDYLQDSKVNLVKAADLVSATVSTLQLFRTDEEWNKLFCYAQSVAEVNQIHVPITSSRPRRQTQLPEHLHGGIVVAPILEKEKTIQQVSSIRSISIILCSMPSLQS